MQHWPCEVAVLVGSLMAIERRKLFTRKLNKQRIYVALLALTRFHRSLLWTFVQTRVEGRELLDAVEENILRARCSLWLEAAVGWPSEATPS